MATQDNNTQTNESQKKFKYLLNSNRTELPKLENRDTRKPFIVYNRSYVLSAGASIIHMLSEDKQWNSEKSFPLFRDQKAKEITDDVSNALLNNTLKQAKFSNYASAAHSLRAGGARAYADSPVDGKLVSGFIVLLLSDANFDYIHALQEKLGTAGTAITLEKGINIAKIPGPLRQYMQKQ